MHVGVKATASVLYASTQCTASGNAPHVSDHTGRWAKLRTRRSEHDATVMNTIKSEVEQLCVSADFYRFGVTYFMSTTFGFNVYSSRVPYSVQHLTKATGQFQTNTGTLGQYNCYVLVGFFRLATPPDILHHRRRIFYTISAGHFTLIVFGQRPLRRTCADSVGPRSLEGC